LSLLQIERVKNQIQTAFPSLELETLPRESRGDLLQDIPLQTVEGTDFFTADLYRGLTAGEADIAIHSLKDMSAEHFFGQNYFAVVDREDTRDVAIFNNDISEKIASGKKIVIGTCSPRREEMAIRFLSKALPSIDGSVLIEAIPIRGNVETRLGKLNSGEYDGTILATAGLNRLLKSAADRNLISNLLADKKMMILPLIECVPAPCQGAIVAECLPGNKKAIEILQAINNVALKEDCIREKKTASAFGTGCIQKFGVTSLGLGNKKYSYAAGRDQNDQEIDRWSGLTELPVKNKRIFSSTDHMSAFFSYNYIDAPVHSDSPVVFIANYKAIHNKQFKNLISEKRVWASGTRTWFELARKGIWVEGCADALGLESLLPVFDMPLMSIKKSQIRVITHTTAAKHWESKGWLTMPAYTLIAEINLKIKEEISRAEFIFWTSYSQFELYRSFINPD
ncbi:MAG: hypothetical protein ACRC2O_01450, partial [Chitinophagaceae bacterium]